MADIPTGPIGFRTRTQPVFARTEDERRHRIERLAGACRIFGRFGYSEGLLGHLTVRDPEHADRFAQVAVPHEVPAAIVRNHAIRVNPPLGR